MKKICTIEGCKSKSKSDIIYVCLGHNMYINEDYTLKKCECGEPGYQHGKCSKCFYESNTDVLRHFKSKVVSNYDFDIIIDYTRKYLYRNKYSKPQNISECGHLMEVFEKYTKPRWYQSIFLPLYGDDIKFICETFWYIRDLE